MIFIASILHNLKEEKQIFFEQWREQQQQQKESMRDGFDEINVTIYRNAYKIYQWKSVCLPNEMYSRAEERKKHTYFMTCVHVCDIGYV